VTVLTTLTLTTLTLEPGVTPYPAPPGTVPCAETAELQAAPREEHLAAPGSPVARACAREQTAPDGALPVRSPEGKVEYTVPPLRYLTDLELAQWTHALLAEHARRIPRYPRP